jgi:CubicO group peptidase (beta-lactamase class C family)
MWRKVKLPECGKGERGGNQERSDAIVRACKLVSRRRLLTAVAAAAVSVAAGRSGARAQDKPNGGSSRGMTGPHFDPGGPDAVRYGQGEGYPVPDAITARSRGNPWEPRYRVGAFSHLDHLYPTRAVARAAVSWAFKYANAPLRYQWRGQSSSLDDYLARNPVSGLLIARDNVILVERYQYARTDRDRLLSQSMVKSITGVLVGLAIADGAIRSVDDTVEAYVPGFKGSEYGRTPLRDLLHMASGVDFGEARDGGRDLNRLWDDLVLGSGVVRKGSIASMIQFNHRLVPPGTRFHYASIEPDVLGQVLRRVLGRPLSQYLAERVWRPIGAEADATWLLDAEGCELPHFGFSAVLRDWARLGRLLAHDGTWEGKQVVPASWMRDATTVRPADAYLAPGSATPYLGYGYLLWLLAGERRQFALLGANGQRICIDPSSKLVMVHTALEEGDEVWSLWSAAVREFA